MSELSRLNYFWEHVVPGTHQFQCMCADCGKSRGSYRYTKETGERNNVLPADSAINEYFCRLCSEERVQDCAADKPPRAIGFHIVVIRADQLDLFSPPEASRVTVSENGHVSFELFSRSA